MPLEYMISWKLNSDTSSAIMPLEYDTSSARALTHDLSEKFKFVFRVSRFQKLKDVSQIACDRNEGWHKYTLIHPRL